MNHDKSAFPNIHQVKNDRKQPRRWEWIEVEIWLRMCVKINGTRQLRFPPPMQGTACAPFHVEAPRERFLSKSTYPGKRDLLIYGTKM